MAAPAASERAQARRETLRLLLPPPGVHHRQRHHHRLDHLRRARPADHAVRPVQRLLGRPSAAEPGALVRHRPDRPRRPVAGHGRLARRADRRPAGGPARSDGRHVPRPDHGLLPGPDGRHPEPPRRGVPGAAGHPRRAADAGRPRHVTAGRRLRRRHPVHADRRADGPLGGPVGAGARLRHGRQAPRRDRVLHPVARDLPQRPRPDRRRDDGPLRVRDLHGRHAVVPRRRPPAAVAGLGPERQRGVHEHDRRDLVVRRSSPPSPSPARSSPST